MTTPDERHLTEAEYAAMLPFRMQRFIDSLNETIAAALPEGMRFEWCEPGRRTEDS